MKGDEGGQQKGSMTYTRSSAARQAPTQVLVSTSSQRSNHMALPRCHALLLRLPSARSNRECGSPHGFAGTNMTVGASQPTSAHTHSRSAWQRAPGLWGMTVGLAGSRIAATNAASS